MKKYTKKSELKDGAVWKNDIVIGTTPEYFKRLAEKEMNVEKATDFLNKLGIKVKTEYGNYRPTYDILADIGDAMNRT